MRRRTAHVEIFDGRSVLRPAGRGPQEEELFERQLALKNVAFRQTKLTLEIERRHHLAVRNQLPDVRREHLPNTRETGYELRVIFCVASGKFFYFANCVAYVVIDGQGSSVRR